MKPGNFSDMVTQSVMARFLSILILGMIMVAAIVIATVDMISGHPIPEIVQTIIWFGIGTAGTIIGVNFGIVLQPSPPPGQTTSANSAQNGVKTP